jgi:hypothetical protein
MQNFFLQDSREASPATNFDSRVSQESRENFGSKKQVLHLARISKVILVSTLIVRKAESPNYHVNTQYRVDTKWRFQFFAKYDYRFLLDVIIAIIATFSLLMLDISHKR